MVLSLYQVLNLLTHSITLIFSCGQHFNSIPTYSFIHLLLHFDNIVVHTNTSIHTSEFFIRVNILTHSHIFKCLATICSERISECFPDRQWQRPPTLVGRSFRQPDVKKTDSNSMFSRSAPTSKFPVLFFQYIKAIL